jgi:hypothetical protein
VAAERPSHLQESWAPDLWAAFCEHHGQDPDDPDAFGVTPPNRLRRMMAEFRAAYPREETT